MSFEEFHALLDEIKEEPDIEEALQELEITSTEAVDDQGSEQQGAGTREGSQGMDTDNNRMGDGEGFWMMFESKCQSWPIICSHNHC